jgi:hypothetical protein
MFRRGYVILPILVIVLLVLCITYIISRSISINNRSIGKTTRLPSKVTQPNISESQRTTLTGSEIPTPVVEHDLISSDGYTVIGGKVYKLLSSGEKELFLDNVDFRENAESYLGEKDWWIKGSPYFQFLQVVESPDKTKVYLLAYSGISLELLYYSTVEGKNFAQLGIADASEVVWSNNSRYIAYLSKPADAGPLQIIQIYDSKKRKEVLNIRSFEHDIENVDHDFLGYSNLRWLNDDSGVIVNYIAYKGMIPESEIINKGEVTINIGD